MKLKFVLVTVFLLSLSLSSFSQATSNDELDAIVTLLGAQKRDLVKELVNITPKDSANFWKVYSAFEQDQKKSRKERIQSFEAFANAYNKMDDKTADELAKKLFETRLTQEKLFQQYFEKVKAATNATLALQFYQAETYYLTLARASIMQQLPTYGQVSKQKK
ncbi:MAG TPA: hypothetical protein VGQ59_16020 [Cyclobacteriaceae bacterium]|jgi:hypothetical protein|nr:hypothetical protein [Cyclobacteriaceae bacterium]